MIIFRQKDFSNYISSYALKGAALGATLGTTASASGLAPTKLPKFVPGRSKYEGLTDRYQRKIKESVPKFSNGKPTKETQWRDGYENASSAGPEQKLLFTAGTTILGAALGALIGTVKTINEKWSQKHTNQRLLKGVLPELQKKHKLVEGVDFTCDPKRANELQTKVCIVLSSASGDLQILTNLKNDPKLEKLAERILRGVGGRMSVDTRSNRFNEITIATEKNASRNVNQVVSIVKSFVEGGYPVYIIEVG